ncbi:MAG: hypothetical protein DRI24_23085, partial [Deltaproteobacteria bacterium]
PVGFYQINLGRSLGSYFSIVGSSPGGHVLTQYKASNQAWLVTSELGSITIPTDVNEIPFIARAN